jgi:hypothetical protein
MKEVNVKKSMFFVVLFSTLSVLNGLLNAGWTVKGGFNTPLLRGGSIESIQGMTLGIGKDWQIVKKAPLYFAFDLLYSKWGAIYRNITWPPNDTEDFVKVVGGYEVPIGDMFLKIGFFEIPFRLVYRFPVNTHLSFSVTGGMVLTFVCSDMSKVKNINHKVLTEEEKNSYVFDYRFIEAPSFSSDNSGWDFIWGGGIQWERLGMEILYVRANHYLKETEYLFFQKIIKIDTFHLLVTFNL